MSNESFKSVKSVDEQFSELAVSGNAFVHKRLYVNDLVATQVVNAPPGKELKEHELEGTLNGTTSVTLAWAVHPVLEIVAVELKAVGSVAGAINVGNAAGGAQLMSGASPPARVSSVYSQSLGSSGSSASVSITANGSLYIESDNVADTSVDVTVKVYYYES